MKYLIILFFSITAAVQAQTYTMAGNVTIEIKGDTLTTSAGGKVQSHPVQVIYKEEDGSAAYVFESRGQKTKIEFTPYKKDKWLMRTTTIDGFTGKPTTPEPVASFVRRKA